MKTTVILENLKFHAFHGVMPQERSVGNSFLVSIRLDYPFDRAMASDDLQYTVNYAEAFEIVRKEMEIPSKLLEHVAGRIHTALLSRYPSIQGGFIKIEKSNPPIAGICGTAAVEIAW